MLITIHLCLRLLVVQALDQNEGFSDVVCLCVFEFIFSEEVIISHERQISLMFPTNSRSCEHLKIDYTTLFQLVVEILYFSGH